MFKSAGIDEEGYLHFGGIRVSDDQVGHALLSNLEYAPNNSFITKHDGHTVQVECFDQPFVVSSFTPLKAKTFKAHTPHGFTFEFELTNLKVDEWDRFHGVTNGKSLPFVMSRKAQAQFFNLMDELEDDRICYQGLWIDVPPLFSDKTEINTPQFWNQKYQQPQAPGWELEKPHPALEQIIAQLKLSKLRILVLGCGSGNDTAFLAEQGHLVTAIDFSKHAIENAKKKYGHLNNIQWLEHDIFEPSPYLKPKSFDLIFEHTCFCAITPSRRTELVTRWRSLLDDGGHVLAIFFTMWKPEGPPFGATEWEVKKRLDPYFRFLYWHRLKPPTALESRLGKELLVYAQKKQIS